MTSAFRETHFPSTVKLGSLAVGLHGSACFEREFPMPVSHVGCAIQFVQRKRRGSGDVVFVQVA